MLVALVLAWLTWGRWGDLQMDCGRELYVPAEILRGKLLYRDLWYPFGPLEPYLAAGLLGLFGRRLYVLYLLGLISAAGSALVLFDIGSMLEAPMVGLTAGLVLLFQGFAPSVFNYIFPWAYAGPLGMLLSLLCASFAIRHVVGRPGHNIVLAGLFAGFALLCKQEFGAACYLMLIFVLAADALSQRSVRVLLREVAACTPGAALAAAIYGWFFWTLTPRFMLQENWVGLPGTYFARVGGPQLYAFVGMRFVPTEIAQLVLDAVLALLLWSLIARLSRTVAVRRLFIAGELAAVGLVVASIFVRPIEQAVTSILTFPTGMFFIGCGFLTSAVYKLRSGMNRRAVAEAAFTLFALSLSVRVFARVVPFGYSIYYDGPLFLVFVIALARCVAYAVSDLAVEPRRELINCMLAIVTLLLAVTLVSGRNLLTADLKTSWGTLHVAPAEAPVARQVLDFIEQQKKQGNRVALLPELPMMYALTGTESPSRWYTILPGYLSPAGERRFIADLERADPGYIILTNRYTGEFGMPYFGLDYDTGIYRWIRQNYEITGAFGNFRRDGSRLLTALLYRRRAAADRPVSMPQPQAGAKALR